MTSSFDMRVPLVLAPAEAAGEGDVLLIEAGPVGTARFTVDGAGHAVGCTCCQPRNAAGRALSALLQDRARGRVAFFHRVVVVAHTPAGRAAVEAALAGDPVAATCFRQVRHIAKPDRSS